MCAASAHPSRRVGATPAKRSLRWWLAMAVRTSFLKAWSGAPASPMYGFLVKASKSLVMGLPRLSTVADCMAGAATAAAAADAAAWAAVVAAATAACDSTCHNSSAKTGTEGLSVGKVGGSCGVGDLGAGLGDTG